MPSYSQAIRFAVVGLITAVIYYGCLLLAVEKFGLTPLVASGFCYVIAVVANYFLHYHWTFTATVGHALVINRYILMLCGGFILNSLVMYTGVTLMAWNYLLVQTVAIGMIAGWNFVLSSLWVFRT